MKTASSGPKIRKHYVAKIERNKGSLLYKAQSHRQTVRGNSERHILTYPERKWFKKFLEPKEFSLWCCNCSLIFHVISTAGGRRNNPKDCIAARSMLKILYFVKADNSMGAAV
jgi:hypothetical protein